MNEEKEDSILFYGNYCVQSIDSETKKKKKAQNLAQPIESMGLF